MITLEEVEKLYSIIAVKFNDHLKEKKLYHENYRFKWF